jgi:hypothetical protein
MASPTASDPGGAEQAQRPPSAAGPGTDISKAAPARVRSPRGTTRRGSPSTPEAAWYARKCEDWSRARWRGQMTEREATEELEFWHAVCSCLPSPEGWLKKGDTRASRPQSVTCWCGSEACEHAYESADQRAARRRALGGLLAHLKRERDRPDGWYEEALEFARGFNRRPLRKRQESEE